MAEEKAAPAPDVKAKTSPLFFIIAAAGTVLVAATAAVLVFAFVIKPRMAAATEEKAPTSPLANAVSVPFDEAYVTLIMESPDIPSSILQYKVTMDVSNQETADLIARFKPRFIALIREAHSYRRRDEMTSDPMLEKSILRQVQQESNKMLQELQPTPKEQNRIIDVYHEKFFIQDM